MTDHQAKALTRDSLVRYYGHKSPHTGNIIKLYKIVAGELHVWHGWNLKWRKLPRSLIFANIQDDKRVNPISKEAARGYERRCANHLLNEVQDWFKANPE